MKPGAGHSSRGFTLIEIIVALVIVAVMGTMIYTYLGTAFSQSVTPVLQLQKYTDLHRAMENIRAAYQGYPKWRSGTVYAAGATVIPTNPNGRYYTCTTGGRSGSTEPAWFQGSSSYTDGTVVWGAASNKVDLTTLKTNIGTEGTDQDNTYGKYYVVANRFIKFDSSGAEQDDSSGKNNILKVAIRNTTSDTSKYKLGGFLEILLYSY